MTRELLARLDHLESLINQSLRAEEQPYTVSTAASYLDISKAYLYQLTSRGVIAHFKPHGKKLYFQRRDLDGYLYKNRISSIDEMQAASTEYTQGQNGESVGRAQ